MTDEKRLAEMEAQIKQFQAQMTQAQTQLDEERKGRESAEKALEEKDKQIRSRDTQVRVDKATAAFEQARKDGRIAPVVSRHFEALIGQLAESDTVVKFRAGEKEAEKDMRPLEILEAAFAALPPVADFREKFEAAGKDGQEEPDGADYGKVLHDRIVAYQADHPEVTYTVARDSVLKKDPELAERYTSPAYLPR